MSLTACGAATSSPSPFTVILPGPVPVTYAGTIQDSLYGSGTLQVSLSAVQGVMGGTWHAVFAARTEPTLISSGTVTSNTYVGLLHPSEDDNGGTPGCQFTFSGTFVEATFAGTYQTFAVTPACPVARSGSFSVAK